MESISPFQWYVLKVQTNREGSIKAALERKIKRDSLSESFGKIIIPTEKIIENRDGRKVVKERKLYPGYILIEMAMSDDAWYLVRDISGVGDFTGSAGKPYAMDSIEVEKMLGLSVVRAAEPKAYSIDLIVGDLVKVKSGPFEAFDGRIESIDDTSGKVAVLIEIFGRPTPVEFEYYEIERP